MCLKLQKKYPKQKDGAIRYKVVKRANNKSKSKKASYLSKVKGKPYLLGRTYRARPDKNKTVDAQGFHVFTTLRSARIHRFLSDDIIIECVCSGFVAGGQMNWSRTKNEIWHKIKIVKEVK